MVEDYEGLSLVDLKAIYEEKIKTYNENSSNIDLYEDCVYLSKLIQIKEAKIQFGGVEQITKAKCEICNKLIENTDEAKEKHTKIHNTWVNYTDKKTKPAPPQTKTELKVIEESQTTTEQNKERPPEITTEIINIAKEIQSNEEQILKELVEEIKKPTDKTPKSDILKDITKPKHSIFSKKSKEPKPDEIKPKKEKIQFGFPRRRYKKPSFGLKGQFPIMEVLVGGGPMILMKNADRSVEILRAKKLSGKFFETDIGVFELDGEYEHRFNKITSFYVYNVHNAKPLSLRAIESIQQYYKNNQTSVIVGELAKVKTAIKATKQTDPLSAMATVFKDTSSKIDDITKKFLVEYLTFDKDDVKLFIQNRRKAKRPSLQQTKPITTIIPVLILATIGISVVLIMRFFNPLILFDIPI